MSQEKVKLDRCDCEVVHENVVEQARQKMPDDERMYELSDLFAVFGDFTRVRILWALDQIEMCVCDISFLLNMTQSAISHQLRILKQADLVKSRKEGKNVYYSLKDAHVQRILKQGLSHVEEKI